MQGLKRTYKSKWYTRNGKMKFWSFLSHLSMRHFREKRLKPPYQLRDDLIKCFYEHDEYMKNKIMLEDVPCLDTIKVIDKLGV